MLYEKICCTKIQRWLFPPSVFSLSGGSDLITAPALITFIRLVTNSEALKDTQSEIKSIASLSHKEDMNIEAAKEARNAAEAQRSAVKARFLLLLFIRMNFISKAARAEKRNSAPNKRGRRSETSPSAGSPVCWVIYL